MVGRCEAMSANKMVTTETLRVNRVLFIEILAPYEALVVYVK
jgi:hypothetical protein